MTGVDDVPCPECGRLFGQHTMIEFREHTATRLPFQAVDNPTFQQLAPGGQVIVDHLDVAASVLQVHTELAGVLYLPAVEFRFHCSDGTAPTPIVFIAESDRTWKDLSRMVSEACGLAPMRAKQHRRAAAGGGR